jgi:hypothetical protein
MDEQESPSRFRRESSHRAEFFFLSNSYFFSFRILCKHGQTRCGTRDSPSHYRRRFGHAKVYFRPQSHGCMMLLSIHFILSLYAPSMTLSSNRPSFAMIFALLQSPNARLPLVVTTPHAYWLATMIEYLSSSALVRSIHQNRRSTMRSFSRRKCPPGQISS